MRATLARIRSIADNNQTFGTVDNCAFNAVHTATVLRKLKTDLKRRSAQSNFYVPKAVDYLLVPENETDTLHPSSILNKDGLTKQGAVIRCL